MEERGIITFTSVELIQVVLKNVKKQEAKLREEEVAAKSRNINVTILQWQLSPAATFLRNQLKEGRKSKMLLQTYEYICVTTRIDVVQPAVQ